MAGLWTEERRKEKKSKKKGELAEARRQNVMRTLMSTYDGRQFVFNILEGCGMFYAETFAPNALAMAYDGGKRAFGFRFLKDINDKCPEYYVQMIKEANERSTDDGNRTSTDSSPGEHPGGEDAGGPIEGGDGTADPDAPDPHGYYIGYYRP